MADIAFLIMVELVFKGTNHYQEITQVIDLYVSGCFGRCLRGYSFIRYLAKELVAI